MLPLQRWGEGTQWSHVELSPASAPGWGRHGCCHPVQADFFFFFLHKHVCCSAQQSPGERNRLLCNGPRCFRRSAAAAPRPTAGPAAVRLWGGAGWDRAPLSPRQLRLFLWSGPRGQDGVKRSPAPCRGPLLPGHQHPVEHPPTAPAPSMGHLRPNPVMYGGTQPAAWHPRGAQGAVGAWRGPRAMAPTCCQGDSGCWGPPHG